MNKSRLLFLILALLTAARIAAVIVELPSPEEAYYYVCSQHPAGAYFDGPPGTAWVVGVLAHLGGPDYIWRLTAPLWALVASLLVYVVGRSLLDKRAGIVASLALNALPAFNVEALRVSPWLPALTFVVAALLFAWRGFEADKKPLPWWLATAVCIGLATLFDYRAGIIFLAIATFILSSPKHRRNVDIFGVLLMVIIPLLMLSPALWWNARQNWIPIAGGTFRTLWSFNIVEGFASLIGVFYFISPILLVLLLASAAMVARAMKTRIRARFIFVAAIFPALLGLYSLLRGADAVFYFLLASPLLLAKAAQYSLEKPQRRLIGGAALVLAVLLSCHTIYYSVQGGKIWSEASREVRQLFLDKLAEGQNHIFLIAEDAPVASVLGYYLRGDLIPPDGHPPVYVCESQDISNQYGLWPSYGDFVETAKPTDEFFTEQKGENPFVGRDALYVTSEKAQDVPQAIKAAFESVSLLKTYPMGGNPDEPLYIYLCLNYQTLPL